MERGDNLEECSQPMPETVTASYKTFGGFTATCSKCSFVCGYWECACELEHECEDY